jgi:hypothetical protein
MTAEAASTSVLLRWQYEPCDYFAGFTVDVSENAGATFRRIATVRNTLGFNATNLAPNTDYVFRVNTFDILGVPSWCPYRKSRIENGKS